MKIKIFMEFGLLLFQSSTLLKLFEKYDANMLNSVRNSIEKGHEDLYFFRLNEKSWNNCKDISIDYAILEKTNNISVVKAHFLWSDLEIGIQFWKMRRKMIQEW